MMRYLFLISAILELNFGQRCEWIDSITTRKAEIKGLDDGLHRRLTMNLQIGSSNRFIDCFLAYKFIIPAGAYVDLDNLKEHRTHLFTAKKPFNIEAPKEQSKNTALYACSKRTLRKNFVYNEYLELPIHLRYHAPTGNDAIVTVPPPQLLLRCSENSTFLNSFCKKYIVKASCNCSSELQCDWLIMPLLESNDVEFRIPTGNAKSLKFVLIITVFVVVSCVIAIIAATLTSASKTKAE